MFFYFRSQGVWHGVNQVSHDLYPVRHSQNIKSLDQVTVDFIGGGWLLWNSDIRIKKEWIFSKKLHLTAFPSLFHVATRRGLKAHSRHGSPRSGTDMGGGIYNAIKTPPRLQKKYCLTNLYCYIYSLPQLDIRPFLCLTYGHDQPESTPGNSL